MNIRKYTSCVKSLLSEMMFNHNTHLFVSSMEENSGISNKKRFGIEHTISVNKGLIPSVGGLPVGRGGFLISPTYNRTITKPTMYTTIQNRIQSIVTQSLNKGLLFLMVTLLSFFAHNISAQQYYPVRVQPQVVVPSVFISDYTDPFNFKVKVGLNDLSKINYRINLHIEIKGSSNLTIKSINPLQLTLDGGEVYFLNQQDLAQLLRPANLEGLPVGAALSEGAYTFMFEATDAQVAPTLRVSNKLTDQTQVLLQISQPPLLNQPANRTEFDLSRQGQNIFFSWTPRSIISSPNQRIKYELRIVKLEPVDRNPYEAMQSGAFMINNRPFDDISYPSFIYDQSQFQLEEGAVYAWQVRAYEEILNGSTLEKAYARFHQGGFSDVYTFSVKENCFDFKPIASPEVIPDPLTGEDLIALRWSGDLTHTRYEVKYRPLGSVVPWTVAQTDQPELILGKEHLEKGITYEYTVAARCKIWLPSAYGGTFKLEKPDCEAPQPLYITHNNPESLSLRWDASEGAQAYQIHYTRLPEGEATLIESHVSTNLVLPAMVENSSYKIKVDAVCSNKTALGTEQTINFGEQGFVGECPLPSPFQLLAQRNFATGAHPLEANLSWNTHSLHRGYVFEYWHRDSTNTTRSIANDQPRGIAQKIIADQLYQYRITFECAAGKFTTSPVGMFRIDGAFEDPGIIPGTANCFPPGQKSAEARKSTEARFDWNKVTGANEYQLFYAPHGTDDYQLFTTTASNAKIKDLIEHGKYDYKIRCRCGADYSIFSEKGMVDLGNPTENEKCEKAPFFIVKHTTTSQVQLAWANEAEKTGYNLYFKENAQSWSDQYTLSLQDMELLRSEHLKDDTLKYTITDLKPGTTYNFKLQAYCGTETAQINLPIDATTKEDERDCASNQTCDRSSTTPIDDIVVGQTIQVADYDIEIKSITKNANGTWSGNAIAYIPFIGQSEHIQLDAVFTDLEVNDASCTTGGNIEFQGISVYAFDEDTRRRIQEQVDRVSDIIKEADNIAGNINDGLQTGIDTGNELLDRFQGGGNVGRVKTGGILPTIEVPETINTGSITKNNNGVVINDTQYNTDFPVLIQDGDEKVFHVAPDGTVSEVGQYDRDLAGLHEQIPPPDGPKVTFSKHNDAVFEFDAYIPAYGSSIAMKGHYLKLGENYYSAKATTPNYLDPVHFQLENGQSSNLRFVNREGFVYNFQNNTLQLAGGPTSDAQEILAVYTMPNGEKKVIGALLLASYEPKQKKVVIVPVSMPNGMSQDLSLIQTELNKVYAKAGIQYTVEYDESFKTNRDWCMSANCTFTPTGSALLSNEYTGDEKNVIETYINFKGEDNLDPEAAYLFAVGAQMPQNSEELLQGKMQFTHQFGYLYSARDQSAQMLGQTLAHELGHGNYALRHTFDRIYLGAESKGTTTNIMDYTATGKSLNKLQWDVIHDPGVVWGVFSRDKDQEMLSYSVLRHKLAEINYTDNEQIYFIKPDGNLIRFSSIELHSFTFDAEFVYVGTNSLGEIARRANASLTGFCLEKNEERKCYGIRFRNNRFQGYYDNSLQEEDIYDPLIGYNQDKRFDNNTSAYNVDPNPDNLFEVVIGIEEPVCELTIKKANYQYQTNLDNTIKLSFVLIDDVDLMRYYYYGGCLEWFDEENLPDIAKKWWENSKVSNQFSANEDSFKRITRLLSDYEKRLNRNEDPHGKIFNFNILFDIDNAVQNSVNYTLCPKFIKPSLNDFTDVQLRAYENFIREYIVADESVNTVIENGDNNTIARQLVLRNRWVYNSIDYPNRIKALKALCQGNLTDYKIFGTQTELVALKLLETTPEDQVQRLLHDLVDLKIGEELDDYPHLLAKLYNGLDSDNFVKFSFILGSWLIDYPIGVDIIENDEIKNDTKILIFTPGLLGTEVVNKSFKDNGKVKFITTTSYFKVGTYYLEVAPYDNILVFFSSDFDYGDKRFFKELPYSMPACLVYSFLNEKQNQDNLTRTKIAVNIGLCFVGVGQLRAAIAGAEGLRKAYLATMGIAELSLAFADATVTVFREQISTVHGGREFLEDWDTFQLYSGALFLSQPFLDRLALKILSKGNQIRQSADLSEAARRKVDDMLSRVDAIEVLKNRLKSKGFSNIDDLPESLLRKLDGLEGNQVSNMIADFDQLKNAFRTRPELVDSWRLLENSARRTDIKTLKFFDDPTVVASRQKILNEKIYEAFPDVPLEELTAIQHYTTNAHLNLNKALRGEIPMTDEYRAFEELLNSGMDKLPKYNGDKVFRGVKGDEAILAKTWKEGDNISFNDFKSTSTKASVANEFAGDVVYEISNPKGRNICGVSCLPGESEVLFKPGSNFKVKEIKTDFVVYDDDFNPFTVRKVILEFVE